MVPRTHVLVHFFRALQRLGNGVRDDFAAGLNTKRHRHVPFAETLAINGTYGDAELVRVDVGQLWYVIGVVPTGVGQRVVVQLTQQSSELNKVRNDQTPVQGPFDQIGTFTNVFNVFLFQVQVAGFDVSHDGP